MHEFSNEVHVKLDVFVVLMLNWIFGDLDSTLFFALEGGRMMLLESKI